MTASCWQFWIDVGGTFTDCFARSPSGELRRYKLLSTGLTQGAVGTGSDRQRIVDAGRKADPPRCWLERKLHLLDDRGKIAATGEVIGFAAQRGALQLSQPLPIGPRPGQAYQLDGGEDSPVAAIRYLLNLSSADPIPPVQVKLGTTRGTNALLTRKGARSAFVTTRGFGDLPYIGDQTRPRLFDLEIRKPAPLCAAIVEIDERLAADGTVLKSPSEQIVREQLKSLRKQGFESLAICLLHALANPTHELLVERVAREVGFAEISVSHRAASTAKLVSRGETTNLDAYLTPVLRGYLERLRAALPGSELRLMTSAGGLVAAEHFSGKESLLSGPAGGVVGFARAAEAAGFSKAIGFDMGGTSTDVSRWDGRTELNQETIKAGVRVVAPMLAIETVAAGGGSICRFDGMKLIVGPESAAADPGPACYGRGGPLCLTDCNLYLGKIPFDGLPFPLDRRAVETQLKKLAAEVQAATGQVFTLEQLAEGFVRIGNAHMVQAIRTISMAKGYDPREYVLVAFGGAAGQHACAVAEELGIGQILLHPDAGLLSAYGIGHADHGQHRRAAVDRPYTAETIPELEPLFLSLAADARQVLLREGVEPQRIELRRTLEVRYRGVDASLTLHDPDRWGDRLVWEFEEAHRRLYGYIHPNRPLEIVAVGIEAVGRTADRPSRSERLKTRLKTSLQRQPAYFCGQWIDVPVFSRAELLPGDELLGPAILRETTSTVVIDPDWRGEILSGGELLLMAVERTWGECKPESTGKASGTRELSEQRAPDPIQLEVFNQRFSGIAEQMGVTLRNTAGSVNVKERLDFSCALFTANGDLVVNAPHIPVHLGGMSETVKRLLAEFSELQAGDVLVTNDPYRGGSHLPDVTVVTPVFDELGVTIRFFTASRAHHAEIGGIVPGSMPPFAQNLAEEGVLIRPFKLIDAGREQFDKLAELLRNAPYPSRAIDDNLADVRAQVAANQRGAELLRELIGLASWPVVETYMRHIQSTAERKLRAKLATFSPGRREFRDHLDDGSPICVTVTILHAPQPSIVFDFSGTADVSPGNLNANRAIVTAAVLYVLRCLVDEDIALNQGLLAPVEILLPVGLLNPPERARPEDCPAMSGGNVETSQRVVDVLLGALDLAAASQGTMNNLLFGDQSFGYYETICGGSGATARQAGTDAVHTHMTNTRLTDPEVFERRYPIRLHEFSIRRGSGGAGQLRGGNGIVRRIEFLQPVQVSLLTQRRGPYAPYGLHGGAPGRLGRNMLQRADGSIEILPNQIGFSAHPGEILIVETPGGGGWGQSP